MTYKGREYNLAHWFRTTAFAEELARLGVRFQINGIASEEADAKVAWNDYSACDLALAARNLTEVDALAKPASKLVNAWQAGVPALLGPEPAFRRLRRSELDYIEVVLPEDVIAAVARLKDNPSLYRAMIKNGSERAKDFSTERIIGRWVDVLSGPIARAYDAWRQELPGVHLVRFALRIPRHKKAKRNALYDREHGRRILTD